MQTPAPNLPSRPAAQKRKSERTKQRILDAAALVLAKEGYSRTKLTDIAATAKTHPGAIYYYFPSREILVEEVMRHASGRFVDLLSNALKHPRKHAAPKDRLETTIRAGIALILSEDSYTSAYLRAYSELPDDIRSKLKPLSEQYYDIWRDVIGEARASAEIRDDLDASLVRMLILGSITWTRDWYRKDGKRSVEEIADHAVRLFLEGLKGHTPSREPRRLNGMERSTRPTR